MKRSSKGHRSDRLQPVPLRGLVPQLCVCSLLALPQTLLSGESQRQTGPRRRSVGRASPALSVSGLETVTVLSARSRLISTPRGLPVDNEVQGTLGI